MNSKSVTDHFPLTEDFLDFSGRTRRFQVSLRKMIGGDFYVEANESGTEEGYRFEVYSAVYSDPAIGSALRKLRGKVRERLATRYLNTDGTGKKALTHSELCGRISSQGIVVDGSLLGFEELKTILTTHEGFEIRIVLGE